MQRYKYRFLQTRIERPDLEIEDSILEEINDGLGDYYLKSVPNDSLVRVEYQPGTLSVIDVSAARYKKWHESPFSTSLVGKTPLIILRETCNSTGLA